MSISGKKMGLSISRAVRRRARQDTEPARAIRSELESRFFLKIRSIRPLTGLITRLKDQGQNPSSTKNARIERENQAKDEAGPPLSEWGQTT